jgi:hypothetical protein
MVVRIGMEPKLINKKPYHKTTFYYFFNKMSIIIIKDKFNV